MSFYGDSKREGGRPTEMDLMDLQRQHIYFQFELFTKSEIRHVKSCLHYPLLDFGILRQMSSMSLNEGFRALLEAT